MGSGRILVVDDERDFLRYVEKILGGAGYVVSTAADASEALEKLRLHNPDLVILDVMLPDMSGWDLCMEIKRNQGPRVIVLTVPVGDDIERMISRSGCDAFLEKPVTKRELLEAVERIVPQ
jgi:CheY-like chemotaxis protein